MWAEPVRESVPTARLPHLVVESAAQWLLQQDFAVVEQSDARLVAVGPGWNSTKQSALRAASLLTVDVRDGEVVVHAELGALERMQAFVVLLAPLLIAA